jgi:hypothetical protein
MILVDCLFAPIHALLHIANDIRHAGPVWCYWAFAMERYCGMLANAKKSRRWPWMSINHRICDVAQLNQVKVLYHIEKELDLRGQPSETGCIYDECK